MIQARHLTFNIKYGRFIKALERNLKFDDHLGKGTNLQIAAKIDRFKRKYTHYTEVDHTEFDAHVTTEMLKLTHVFYQSCFHHNKELRHLSKKTLVNKCRTRDGIKYKVEGTRMSGDVDTSLGNSLINYAILRAGLQALGIQGDAIVNGDDSILFTNQPVPVDQFEAIMLKFNMHSKVQPSQTNIHKVEFCRNKLIYNNQGQPALMIQPTRLTDILGMTYKPFKDYSVYLQEVIRCFIAINSSNPMCAYWMRIHNAVYPPLDYHTLKTVIETQDTHRDHKRAAIRELVNTPDSGEFNSTIYSAFGNLDILDELEHKITARLKQFRRMHRITSDSLRYIPTTRTVYINHRHKTIRLYKD